MFLYNLAEVVVEIISSSRYEFTSPEIIWKTTAVSLLISLNIIIIKTYH